MNTAPYTMPAEWERHKATWLAWPHDKFAWPNELKEVEIIYCQMVSALSSGEEVHILINNHLEETRVRRILEKKEIEKQNVFYHVIPTTVPWIRDYGPVFMKKYQPPSIPPPTSGGGLRWGDLFYTDWTFNSWGHKYDWQSADNQVPRLMHRWLNIPRLETGMVLEGGSIDVNGQGLCLTTEQCLLNPNRNPKLSREDLEAKLKFYLGITKAIWLGGGITGDDTDGHIDNVTRFVNEKTIVAAVDENESSPNFRVLNENWNQLQELSKNELKGIQLIKLPMPKNPMFQKKSIPGSYANFYIANECVLVPIFEDEQDQRALNILKELFPQKCVIGIDSRALLLGLGAIHCVTQQEPF